MEEQILIEAALTTQKALVAMDEAESALRKAGFHPDARVEGGNVELYYLKERAVEELQTVHGHTMETLAKIGIEA